MPDGPPLSRALGPYAPFEHITRVQAVRDFVDWLYDAAPDPGSVSRDRLQSEYWDAVATQALQSAANEAHERMNERHIAGTTFLENGSEAVLSKLVPFPEPK